MTTKQRDDRFERQTRKISVGAVRNHGLTVETAGVLLVSAWIDEVDRDLFKRKRRSATRLSKAENRCRSRPYDLLNHQTRSAVAIDRQTFRVNRHFAEGSTVECVRNLPRRIHRFAAERREAGEQNPAGGHSQLR